MKSAKKKVAKAPDPTSAWAVGMYMWPKKGGWFKRLLQPAKVELFDGTTLELGVRLHKDGKAVIKAVKALQAYYDSLPAERKKDDHLPMERKRGLPRNFSVVEGWSPSRGVDTKEFIVTPWEAKLLGDRLLAFARAEKAVPPCGRCQTQGRVMGPDHRTTVPCQPCRGTGWLKAPKKAKGVK
jgi:hypothetical protein